MDVITMYPDFRQHFAEKVEVTIDMRDVSKICGEKEQRERAEDSQMTAGFFFLDLGPIS